MSYPLISVLVAFYNDKNTLARCLNSIVNQTYKNFELIIVNDGSIGKDQNKEYKTLIKQVQKENKKNNFLKRIIYYTHKKNLGIVESRRTCIKLCSGQYCIFVDSDDFLENCALEVLYKNAEKENADIVQGSANVIYEEQVNLQKIKEIQERCSLIHFGILKDDSITEDFLCNHGHANFMWAKLFKTSVVQFAFQEIPKVYASLAEDLLIYFFISKNAITYCGINDVVYNYNISSGMTSKLKINELTRWEQLCSVSLVFKILYLYMEQNNLPENQIIEIKKLCVFYLKNNLHQLKQTVDESIQIQAKSILYDYWGESFVKRVENML